MGVDLKLYLNHDAENDPDHPYFAYPVRGTAWDWLLSEPVRLARQRELWPAFEDAEKRAGVTVPACMAPDDEHGWEERTTNPYGGQLTTIPIREVVKALESVDLYAKNRAILAYMRALHPDARVLLWWC